LKLSTKVVTPTIVAAGEGMATVGAEARLMGCGAGAARAAGKAVKRRRRNFMMIEVKRAEE
jgi:hypothetical protein